VSRRTLFTSVLALSLALVAAPATAGPGDFDPSFNGIGYSITDVADIDVAYGVAVHQGLIYSAVHAQPGGFGLTRHTSAGALDTSFSNDGMVVTAFGEGALPADVAVQSDGKPVVAGSTGLSIGVIRYKANGALDGTFGTSGKAKVKVARLSRVEAVAIDKQGRIVVLAQRSSSTDFFAPTDFVVVRLLSNGAPDTAFSGDGVAFVNVSEFDYPRGLAIDGSNRPVIVGSGAGLDFKGGILVARLTAKGGLDSTFSGDGKLKTMLTKTSMMNGGETVGIDGSGRIVVGASASSDTAALLGAIRLTPSGVLDSTYGNNGKARVTCTNGLDCSVYGGGFTKAGVVLVGGGGSGIEQALVARFTNTGQPDTGIGPSGQRVISLPSLVESLHDAAQAGTKLVVAGSAHLDTLVARLGT
jgi:uncharacterized delta-60 repeat protein